MFLVVKIILFFSTLCWAYFILLFYVFFWVFHCKQICVFLCTMNIDIVIHHFGQVFSPIWIFVYNWDSCSEFQNDLGIGGIFTGLLSESGTYIQHFWKCCFVFYISCVKFNLNWQSLWVKTKKLHINVKYIWNTCFVFFVFFV